MAKLHLIGCGGAGINSLLYIRNDLDKLSGSFAKIGYSFIDTTDKTMQAYPEYAEEFTKIESERASVESLDGMGGERADRDTAIDIDKNIKSYVDKLSNNKDIYYIVVASGSGASGSLISPLLTKALLAKKCSTIVSLIGDTSNLLNMHNTINTISTFQKIVSKPKKGVNLSEAALPMIYYNNSVNNVTSPGTEIAVNERIFKMISILAMFCSGNVQNIDHQDMRYFFRASEYKSLDIDPGLYTLGVSIKSLDDGLTVIARTILSSTDETIDIKVPLAHNKTGIVADDFTEYFKEYPIHLLLRQGVMNNEVKQLKETMEEMEKQRKVNYEQFENSSRSEDDDELGLVL